MRAAIALLSDFAVQNAVRRMVFELSQRYDIPFYGSLLPAHVSLKQPFAFESMPVLEKYFASLAQQISPFEIRLDELYCFEAGNGCVLGLNVVETPTLRNLHNQLNRELSQLFSNTAADYDGEAYRFHLTIELGRFEGTNPYRSYFDSLPEKKVNLAFQARQLALFYYTGDPVQFITYKVLPLGGED